MAVRLPRPLVASDHVSVSPRRLETPTALLSIDVETDFGTGRTDVLEQLPRFLGLLAERQLPVTAFVEGQLFERHPQLCAQLVEHGADIQLHVYDHATPGDTLASLRRGADAYAAFIGVRPEGYRAHTYHLTPALHDALVSLGFKWDSSVMRAWGRGRNAHACFRHGDYFVFGSGLVEFPVGPWRHVPLPFNHPYTLLAGSLGGRLLRALSGPSSRLVPYNTHMTDLLWSPALYEAQYGRLFEWMQRWMWMGQGGETLGVLGVMCDDLRQRGFVFETTSGLYRRISGATGTHPPA